MKKSIIALIFVFLTQSASAQESVPLFEDIPAYESSSSASTQTASPVSSGVGRRIDLTPKASQTAETERKNKRDDTKTEIRPRCGTVIFLGDCAVPEYNDWNWSLV